MAKPGFEAEARAFAQRYTDQTRYPAPTELIADECRRMCEAGRPCKRRWPHSPMG